MVVARLLAAALLVAATSADALLTELQRAIGRDDREAVAALIQYPITIMTAGVRIPIRDAASLLQSYDAVFTPELKAAIRGGSAVRDGLIAVASVQGVVKIASISVPYGSRAGHESTTSSPTPRVRPRRGAEGPGCEGRQAA